MQVCKNKFILKFLLLFIAGTISFQLSASRESYEYSPHKIKLVYSEKSTLKPLLSHMVKRGNATKEVQYCYDCLHQSTSVEVNHCLSLLPDVANYLYAWRQEMLHAKKMNKRESESSKQAKDIACALRALSNIKENLRVLKNESSYNAQAVDSLYHVLHDISGNIADSNPENVDDLMAILRFVGSTTGEGIRQIVVKIAATVDMIQSTLDSCCFSLESKIDNFPADITSCCSQLDSNITTCCFTLNSKSDVIIDDVTVGFFSVESKLDDCCFSLESKLDNIPFDITSCCSQLDTNITTCCFTLGSKSDVIITDVTSGFMTVDSKIDVCCFSLESKLDALPSDISSCCATINDNLASCCSKLDSDITTCCFTLNSKSDVIITDVTSGFMTVDSKIDVCCFSLESKLDNLTMSASCDLSPVESQLDACCFSLESKLDNLSISSSCDLSGTFTVLNTIETSIESCCFSLESKLDDCCTTIESKLDSLNPCAATPIYGTTAISNSGTYCLAQNVNQTAAAPAITINGNNIVLDLNGFSVGSTNPAGTGIAVTNLANNVVIKNGTLTGPGTGTTNEGISLTDSSDVRLEKLFINFWYNGIHASGVSNFVIDQITSMGNSNSNDGLLIDSASTDVAVHDSLFNSNTLNSAGTNGNGAEVNGSTNVRFDGCHFDDNNNGIYVDNSSRCIEISNCFACNNAPTGSFATNAGFLISSSNNVVLKNNYACNNRNGYSVSSSIVDLFNNIAEFNKVTGFNMQGGVTATLRDNTSNNNGPTGIGFNDVPDNTNQYYNNTACNNETGFNYSNVTSAPVTSPANARGFDNVDCANTTPDFLLTLTACAATPIYGVTTISASGTYCLAQNITSAHNPIIEINASNVILDLNGFNITSNGGNGIQLGNASYSDVLIKNGSLTGVGAGTTDIGIRLPSGSSDIRLEKLFVNLWYNGIYASGVSNLVIDQIISMGNSFTNDGLLLDTACTDVAVHDSLFNSNTLNTADTNGNGAEVNDSTNVRFDGCHFDDNNNGIYVNNSSKCIEISNCFAGNNTPGGGFVTNSGFLINSSSYVVLKNNYACNNKNGYSVSSSTADLFNNIAESNAIFGFNMGTGTTATLHNNTANNNTTATGFNDTLGNSNQYYNNTACNNAPGLNYVNVNSAPVTSPANARGFDNVDCDNTTPDFLLTLTACSQIPIFGPTVITASGSYCVAQSFFTDSATPAIEIAANNVTLDLNGYTVGSSFAGTSYGIQVDPGISNVVIKNGIIQGTQNGSSGGIYLSSTFDVDTGPKNIRLEKLIIYNWVFGIEAYDADTVVIEDVISTNNLSYGLYVYVSGTYQPVNLEAHNSQFNKNQYGVVVLTSKGLRFENCHFDENTIDGAYVNTTMCVEFSNCFASGQALTPTPSSGAGFHILTSSQDIVLKNNNVCCYTNGYFVDNTGGACNACFINNIAKGNLSDGFNMTSGTTATLRYNTSDNNGTGGSGYGFNDVAFNTNYYYNNTACNNNGPGNYNNVTSAPVTSPANARGVYNVDCSDSTLDQISQLAMCCFSVQSKLDLLLTNTCVTNCP